MPFETRMIKISDLDEINRLAYELGDLQVRHILGFLDEDPKVTDYEGECARLKAALRRLNADPDR
jgi:hypothetical protein